MKVRDAVASALVLIMLLASGCKGGSNDDAEYIASIPEAYIDALAESDVRSVNKYTGWRRYEEVVVDLMSGHDTYDLYLYAVSQTEFEDMGEVVFNDDHTRAHIDVSLSYPNLQPLIREGCGYTCLTSNEIIENIDNGMYDQTRDITLIFEYDEDEDKWYMTSSSARKLWKLYDYDEYWYLLIPEVSLDELQSAYEGAFLSIANGDFDDLHMEYDLEDFRVYDDVSVRGEGEKTQEAVENFVSAYIGYVLDHDHEFDEEDRNSYYLIGSAPSTDDLYNALGEDEFLTQYYMNFIRYSNLGWDLDEMWDDQSALVYNTLADAVPECSPEEYEFEASVDINGIVGPEVSDNWFIPQTTLINEPEMALFAAEHGVPRDQYLRCSEEAINRLYENGEVDERLRDSLIDRLYSQDESSEGNSSSTVHPNQAVNTYEQVPEWCDDQSIVYGYSEPDENGIWMFYSKQPGWLDTVEYYVDDRQMCITCIYDRRFDRGTVLIADWWVDGEQVVDTDRIYITQDNTTIIPVSYELDGFPDGEIYEMRLWEEDHSHVIAYVTLYNTGR